LEDLQGGKRGKNAGSEKKRRRRKKRGGRRRRGVHLAHNKLSGTTLGTFRGAGVESVLDDVEIKRGEFDVPKHQ
jgi:hypothetical protein